MFGAVPGPTMPCYAPPPLPRATVAVAGGGGVNPVAAQTTKDYLEGLRASDLSTQAALGSIIHVLAALAPAGGNISAACSACFEAGGAAAFLANFTAEFHALPVDAANDTDEQKVVRAIAGDAPKAPKWMNALVVAAKGKELEEGNVEGYFASFGSKISKPAVITNIMNKISYFFPDNVNDAAVRDAITEGKWRDYRLCRFHAGPILHQIRDEFLELKIYEDGDDSDQKIIAAKNSPWNGTLANVIPDKLKAYSVIYNDAVGRDLGNYHQGKKALEALPSLKVNAIRKVFKAYVKEKTIVVIPDEGTGIEGIATAATGLW